MRIRRPRWLFLQLQDRQLVDLGSLLQGRIEAASTADLVAISPATGKPCVLESEELALVRALATDRWTPAATLPLAPERLHMLADVGVLITDEERAERRTIRERDIAFEQHGWGRQAALFFVTTAHSPDVGQAPAKSISFEKAAADSASIYSRFVAKHGPPPPAFHEVAARADRLPLPVPKNLQASLDELLLRRRTVRAFDRGRPLSLDDLACLLYATFGCLGTTEIAPDVTLLQRASPSGGSLHPLEAYPLLLNVEAASTGLYHYNAKDHALDLLRPFERAEGEAIAVRFLAGQEYAADAQVVIVLTARFARSFWKYRRSDRAFLVVAMDAGHLGQTFYLACTALGLGPFFSAALDADAIAESLDLETAAEGPMAICGCGWPTSDAKLSLARKPYRFPKG